LHAVLDPNVLISALLSPSGVGASLLRSWLSGSYELVVSPLLVAELSRALAYPKLRKRIEARDAEVIVAWLSEMAEVAADPDDPPAVRSSDPGDDYLIALAQHQSAFLVSGDAHLLDLADRGLPIYSARAFQELLERSS
jgi:putative PIN family toxin of toxin-antitoxin system